MHVTADEDFLREATNALVDHQLDRLERVVTAQSEGFVKELQGLRHSIYGSGTAVSEELLDQGERAARFIAETVQDLREIVEWRSRVHKDLDGKEEEREAAFEFDVRALKRAAEGLATNLIPGEVPLRGVMLVAAAGASDLFASKVASPVADSIHEDVFVTDTLRRRSDGRPAYPDETKQA